MVDTRSRDSWISKTERKCFIGKGHKTVGTAEQIRLIANYGTDNYDERSAEKHKENHKVYGSISLLRTGAAAESGQ